MLASISKSLEPSFYLTMPTATFFAVNIFGAMMEPVFGKRLIRRFM